MAVLATVIDCCTKAVIGWSMADHMRTDLICEAVTMAAVIAELDCPVLTRLGPAAEQAVLTELAGGAWELALMDRTRLAAATRIVEQYRDVPIGVTDAANIMLAQAYRTRDIATLDRRHFDILRFGDGSAPRLLP